MCFSPVRSALVLCDNGFETGEEFAVGDGEVVRSIVKGGSLARFIPVLTEREPEYHSLELNNANPATLSSETGGQPDIVGV